MAAPRKQRTSRRRWRRLGAGLAAMVAAGGLSAGPSVAEGVVRAEPVAETAPAVASGDSMDDPAVWIDPHDPSRSVIIGADHADDSIEVYDLSGGRIQRLVPGGANDVDLRDGFVLGGVPVPLVTVVGSGHMRFYRLDPETRQLENVTRGGVIEQGSSHGTCMYRSPRTGTLYAFRVIRSGRIDQFELVDDGGQVAARPVRTFDVEPRPLADGGNSAMEACVADDETASLFVAEEEQAIWRYGAEPDDPASTSDRVAVDTVKARGGHIVPQVEGLALVHDPHGDGFLIVSDQGDYTFNVYRRLPPYEFVHKVEVVDGPLADGCDRTDGIEAVTADLGPLFPRGMFVCQDNQNTAPAAGNQNFKLVPLERVVPLAEPAPPTTAPPGPGTGPGTSPTTAPPVSSGGSPPAAGSGYWMLGVDGRVFAFGDAVHHGEAEGFVGAAVAAADLEPSPSGGGYWVVDRGGRVFAYGDAADLGGLSGVGLEPGEVVTSLSATPSGAGYWLYTTRGRVVAFGDAPDLGDMAATPLNGEVLDSVATPTGAGYYMVAADGGIFAFGDARFFGSMGGKRLNQPVQSLVPDPDGAGYWLVAADGGVFAFDASFRGSMGATPLNAPVTGMVAFGSGYLMVGTDGGIFNFSDRPFHGSLGDDPPRHPIVAVAALP